MKKLSRRYKILAVISGLFLGWLMLAPFLAESLIVEKRLEKADAILVLGGSATYRERTQKAAELFKMGTAPKIFLTDDGEIAGWSQTEERNPRFVELARNSLLREGVPPENIEILEPSVAGTIDEARIAAEKANGENWRSLLLVTSAYHTRRTLWTFGRVFSENGRQTELGIISPPPGRQTPAPRVWWLSPKGWSFVAGEYVKGFGYWMFY